jgi:hypothetical protein
MQRASSPACSFADLNEVSGREKVFLTATRGRSLENHLPGTFALQ